MPIFYLQLQYLQSRRHCLKFLCSGYTAWKHRWPYREDSVHKAPHPEPISRSGEVRYFYFVHPYSQVLIMLFSE